MNYRLIVYFVDIISENRLLYGFVGTGHAFHPLSRAYHLNVYPMRAS